MNSASSLNGLASFLLPARVAAKVTIDGNDIHPVLSLSIRQTYGEHHRLTLRCYADSIQSAITPTIADTTIQLLGRLAEVALSNMHLPGAATTLHARFIIADLSLEQSYMGQPVVCLTGYSPTWLLDDAPSYESFSNKTLADIARTCAKGLEKARTGIKASPTLTATLSYLCRWRESNWNFLKRISAASGQWLYFNGTDLIFGLPENKEAIALTYGHNCNKASLGMATSSGAPAYSDYDASTHSPMQGKAGGMMHEGGNYGGPGLSRSKDLFGSSGGEAGRETIPPPFFAADRKVLDAVVSADQGGHTSAYYTMKGESTAWQMTVGSLLDVSFAQGAGQPSSGHPVMRVVGVEHRIDEAGTYTNSFSAVSNAVPHPPALSYNQPHTHSVLAEVVSNNDPSGQGRVQVKMLGWVQRHSQQLTDWIRVLTPDGGGTGAVMQNRGQMFIPEAGDQVMIDFVGGNPDRPYVVGSMYHGKNASRQGGSNNTIKTITTRSGNTIILNDAEGSITVSDPSGNVWHMDGQGNINVTAPNNITVSAGQNISINAGANISVTAGANIIEMAGSNLSQEAASMISHVAGADYSLQAANILQEAKETLTHDAREISKFAKEDIFIISESGSITTNADKEIKHNSGDDTIFH